MWRYVCSFILVVGLGIFAWSERPSTHQKTQPGAEVYSVKYETKAKQALLEQDVKLTDDLCRNQCSLDFQKMVGRFESGEPVDQVLREMKTHHEKMDVLIWSKSSQSLEQGIKAGELQKDYADQATAYMKEAKSAADAGTHYQSPKFGQGSQVYFVLGVPASKGDGSLVGVIHQDILHQVTDHQLKNLRLVPYPNENRWKVESVDTDTLKDKVVIIPRIIKGRAIISKTRLLFASKKIQPRPNWLRSKLKSTLLPFKSLVIRTYFVQKAWMQSS